MRYDNQVGAPFLALLANRKVFRILTPKTALQALVSILNLIDIWKN